MRMNSIPLFSGLSASSRFSRLLVWILRSVASLAECPPRAFHSFDVLLHGVESHISHDHAESVLTSNPGLLKSDRAAKRRLDRERRAGANVRMNELLKLPVHSLANREGNALVRSRIQRGGAVIGVEDVIGKIGEWKQ